MSNDHLCLFNVSVTGNTEMALVNITNYNCHSRISRVVTEVIERTVTTVTPLVKV